MAQAKAEENETGLTKDFKKLGRNLRESARERNSEGPESTGAASVCSTARNLQIILNPPDFRFCSCCLQS